MARKTISAWELHIEKAVLGLAAVFLLGGVVYFLLMGGPYQTSGWAGVDSVGPGDVGPKIQTLAESVAQSFKNPPSQGPWPIEVAKEKVPFGTSEYADLRPALPPLQPNPPVLIEGEDSGSTPRHRPLVHLVAPAAPQTRVFRNVLASGSNQSTPPEDLHPKPWVYCASTIDLSRQVAEFRKASYPPDRWELIAYAVQVQRRPVMRSTGGDVPGVWEDVSMTPPTDRPSLPTIAFADDGTASNAERVEIERFAKALRDMQAQILRPELPQFENGGDVIKEPIIPYLRKDPAGYFDRTSVAGAVDPEMGQLARTWLLEADKALNKNTPPDFESAYACAEAAYWAKGIPDKTRDDAGRKLDEIDTKFKAAGGTPPRRDENRRRMPLIAYDLNVDPGRMYQYRMRVVGVNRYAGRPNDLARLEDVQSILIRGEWSEPSAPFEVPSDTYVFVKSIDTGKKVPTAMIEVFHRGSPRSDYEKKGYPVKIGDAIGRLEKSGRRTSDFRTGMVVVDIDPAYPHRVPGADGRIQVAPALICADPKDPDAIREYFVVGDDPKYKELSNGGEPRNVRRAGRG